MSEPSSAPPAPSASFSLPQAFFEAFFVLLGVGLALVADAWWTERRQAQRTAVALAAIEAELTSNLEAARVSQAYHDEKRDLLFGWSAEEPPTADDFPRGFIQPAPVLRSAWETARESGALADLDYHQLLLLSGAYGVQARYEDQTRSIGERIYAVILDRGFAGLLGNYRNLATIISTFSFRERQLIERYEATLAGLQPAVP